MEKTMMAQLITSGQRKTLIRVAHDAAERAAQELGLTKGAADPSLIQIDRTAPFDPVSFIGAGWSIVAQDERALVLTELNLNDVTFKTMLHFGEKCIPGEEKLKRLIASGKIRLDARVFQTLWENRSLIPESWKSNRDIFFYGTILRNPYGYLCVPHLCLCDGEWIRHWVMLDLALAGKIPCFEG
jgi:hypothetical protein